MDLDPVPLEPPEPPQVSNVADPPTIAGTIVAISTICLTLMITLAVLRMYSKVWILRSFGWEDGDSIHLCYASLSDGDGSSLRELFTRNSMSLLS